MPFPDDSLTPAVMSHVEEKDIPLRKVLSPVLSGISVRVSDKKAATEMQLATFLGKHGLEEN